MMWGGRELLVEASRLKAQRGTERVDSWQRDGAIFHMIIVQTKVRRCLLAMTSGDEALALRVFEAEAPDILNYLLFAAQCAQDGDLNGEWPWGFKGRKA